MGSSPHTRGAPRPLAPSLLGSRIIPAYAGSTGAGSVGVDSRRDHPRIRGEHRPRGFRSAPGSGSSPHTRGARDDFLGDALASRIIPAYAGSTEPPRGADVGAADHPRIRGEHLLWSTSSTGPGGSSPHTRGAPTDSEPDRRRQRIIPAYAGSTTRRRACRCSKWDHPRIRGEHRPEPVFR